MKAVLGLMVILLGLSHGVETYCLDRLDGVQCYRALGGTVDIHLMGSTSEIYRYYLLKNSIKILDVRKNEVISNTIGERAYFPSNGTFRINNLSRTDSGLYTLRTFDSDGTSSGVQTLQLFIQAPVSSVLLVSACLSQGEMRVSCSSEGGDSPQYSWTLDGRTLTDAELLSGNNESKNIILKQHVSGRLTCSVRNNVSYVYKEERISACGVETYCDGRQDGAQCYGALGGTVDIQLMDNTSEISRYKVLNNSLKILDVRKNKIISNTIEHRYLFPSNGTFRIKNLSRSDSGNYTLQTFDSDGRSSGEWTLQLFIQAPVSSVLLVSECLSQGERRASCSSEGGDSLQYSWTLNGRTLTDAELLSGDNETNIMTLKQHVSGTLVCSVRNNVSNVSKEERISTCGFIFINCTTVNGTMISVWVHKTSNTLCVEPAQIFKAVICAQRKKKNSKHKKQKEEEDDQEEIFADIRVVKWQAKQLERRAELEFGKVKYSKRPRQTEPTGNACLYGNVHKAM
ncbi:contactin-2-like isoform X2 [Simochromis diagramma]|uniref:contactin-2-like isoform X2 n=1 Tax=Simochromis diagramma TaxID=43689 RepID=UPI001A7EEA06|nr:contactin-2-like isoform X2 [Simochromis diagramma]